MKYYIAVCYDYPAVQTAFPDGIPWAMHTVDPLVTDDGMVAAAPVVVYDDDSDPAESVGSLPITFYPDTEQGRTTAQHDYPMIDWPNVPRFVH